MATFKLNNWLAENRNQVLDFYNELSKEKFFSGVSLRDFGYEVYNGMKANNPRSNKKAKQVLVSVLYNLEGKHTQIGVSYSKPYSESNHAKAVNYHGKKQVELMNNAK
jgi:hypothetical protein